jgi:subtilisin family serine protease
MKIFNVSYTAEADVVSLSSALSELGTIQLTLEKVRVISLLVSDETTAASIEAISGVAFVELDEGTIVVSQSDWHLRRLVSPTLPSKATYSPSNFGENSIVYLMDSGIDSSHTEFTGSSIVNLYSYDNDFSDTLGHGTIMASLINGQTIGVAKNATVKNVKIPFGSVTIAQLLTAFDTVLSDHLLTSTVKVVNCSWTIPKSQLLDNKILELQNEGLVVVAAAGNSGIAADTLSPVGLNTVIGVAASDAYDRVIPWGIETSSNWGPDVDVTAPGINVTIANISGGYSNGSGTSIAAAIVSGVVTQYITDDPSLTAQQIQNLVIDSAMEDMLFRNEEIYGTTPNKLIKSPYLSSRIIWDKTVGTMFPVQRNQTTVLTFTTSASLSNAVYADATVYDGESKNIPDINFFYKAFSWITSSYSNGVLTLTITPDETIEVGKYAINITSVDSNNNEYYSKYTIGVYDVSEFELETIEVERYLTTGETGDTLAIVTAACVYNNDCGKGGFCCGGFCC